MNDRPVDLEPRPDGSAPAAGVSRCPVASLPPDAPQLGEDSFRRVVEWAPSAMVMIDPQGLIVLVNAQTEQMFGYRRQDLIGESVELLVPQRFREHHRLYRGDFFGDPAPRPMGAGRDLFGCHADGSEFPVEIGLNPINTEAGIMVLASIVDLTERCRTQQRLEDALREKTALLNEVHHRVKNNLQVVTSLLNLQAGHAADPRLRAILAESCGRVRAMALTHQLLYERKDFSCLDLGNYLDRLLQSIRATYSAGGDRIALRLAVPDAPLHLDLERAIPCGLLLNELVTNAFKHAFPGERSGTISIELELRTQDGEIVLGVADDGIGLPPEADLVESPSLGLQLVPLFVEQLHGVLDIERGAGCRFTVRFPILTADKETP